MENIEYDINIYGNLMIIDKENETIKTITVPSIKRLFNEKQQLISFLKDNIKKLNNQIKIKEITQQGNLGLLQEIHELRIISLIYQEVLDFVNKGGKE